MGLQASSALWPSAHEQVCAPRTPCRALTSLSRLAGGWFTTPAIAAYSLFLLKKSTVNLAAGSLKISQTTKYQLTHSSGPSGIRTHDLLNAIETRSQLRYGPRQSVLSCRNFTCKNTFRQLTGARHLFVWLPLFLAKGFSHFAPRLGQKCLAPLAPGFSPVDLGGFEPPTSSVRLKRAPNCATGPCKANAIVSEGYRDVKCRPHNVTRPPARTPPASFHVEPMGSASAGYRRRRNYKRN